MIIMAWIVEVGETYFEFAMVVVVVATANG